MIGTLTFHRVCNYGAVLQTYALQQTVKGLGCDSEVIDYRCPFLEEHKKSISIKKITNPKWVYSVLFQNGYIIDLNKEFAEFRKKHIKISSATYYSLDDLKKSDAEYDKYIVGSDQIWNYQCAGYDKAFFLQFVSDVNKKYSYAASIGFETLDNEYVDQYKEMLSGFRKIAVREKSAKALLERQLNLESVVTLDPTLLITKNEWDKLAVAPKFEHYVLVYVLAWSETLFAYARELSMRYGLKVIFINDRLKDVSGMVNLRHVSPEQWIGLFENADYIVTNSFHGTAFSIIMRKPFTTFLLPEPSRVNSRMKDLLSDLGLSSRLYCGKIPIHLDYDSDCEFAIEKKMEESKSYLKTILEV